jgi:two-component system cell cycle response regulator DivK
MAEPLKILSVEDNADTRLLLKHTLKDDYEVAFASGVDEALDAVISESVDLLLLDINLGTERGGVKLLQEIRERDDLADIPAIALTAFAMPGDREDLLACGFDAYVGKPFTHGELTNTIDQTLSDT